MSRPRFGTFPEKITRPSGFIPATYVPHGRDITNTYTSTKDIYTTIYYYQGYIYHYILLPRIYIPLYTTTMDIYTTIYYYQGYIYHYILLPRIYIPLYTTTKDIYTSLYTTTKDIYCIALIFRGSKFSRIAVFF